MQTGEMNTLLQLNSSSSTEVTRDNGLVICVAPPDSPTVSSFRPWKCFDFEVVSLDPLSTRNHFRECCDCGYGLFRFSESMLEFPANDCEGCGHPYTIRYGQSIFYRDCGFCGHSCRECSDKPTFTIMAIKKCNICETAVYGLYVPGAPEINPDGTLPIAGNYPLVLVQSETFLGKEHFEERKCECGYVARNYLGEPDLRIANLYQAASSTGFAPNEFGEDSISSQQDTLDTSQPDRASSEEETHPPIFHESREDDDDSGPSILREHDYARKELESEKRTHQNEMETSTAETLARLQKLADQLMGL